MKNDLIDRYIYAVTKRMNPKIREDVKNELYGLVDDMLMERCGEMTPTEKDIRVVLTELGSPEELYAKYDEDSKKCLIGQPYYSTYKFVLKIVLISAAIGLTIALAIDQIMEPVFWLEAVGNWLSSVWSTLLAAFAFVTLLFAVFYQKGIKIDTTFNFDNLPPVPQKKQKISKWGCISAISFNIICLTLLLGFPQVFAACINLEAWIPIFNAEVIRAHWYIILGSAVAEITRETVKLMEKRYNRTVMLTTIGANVVEALLAVWWLTADGLINPVFVEKMAALFTEEGAFMINMMVNFHHFLLACVIFALVIDTVETVVRTLRK